MKRNPDAFVVAAGFTDNTGDPEYNLSLSEVRVRSVRDYLVRNFNLDQDRIVTFWFGSKNPVADNATSQGRRLNRRVEIAVGGINCPPRHWKTVFFSEWENKCKYQHNRC
jgi:outer membrane protein OmpA-like peptidoglycan-associated protein